MTPPESLDAEALLRHGAWLAQLARALVAKDDEIDDVVQQTYAQALATPPRRATNLRGWLGAIARNVVRASRRRDAARAVREELAPSPTPPETPDELVARAELRRAVVDAVLALAEPYRSAVIRRFFEEQEVAAIARITGSPVATIRTRIRRGVEQVRETLQARAAGDRSDASAALASLFARLRGIAGGEAATIATGGIAMSLAAKSTLAAAALAAAALTLWIARGPAARTANGDGAAQSARSAPVAPVAATAPTLLPPAVAREPEPLAADREAASPKSDAPAPLVKTTSTGTLRGTVVADATGEPVAGVDVWIVDAKHDQFRLLDDAPRIAREAAEDSESARDRYAPIATATTAADGRFECDDLSAFSDWSAIAFDESGRCAASSAFRFDDQHATREVKLRLVPSVVLEGRVMDADRAPIVGAQVVMKVWRGKDMLLRAFETQATPEPGDWNSGVLAATTLDVTANAIGFEPSPEWRHVEVTQGQREVVLDFVLQRSTEALARGPIVDPSGAPIDLRRRLPELFGEAMLDEDVRRHLSVQAFDASLPVLVVGSPVPDWSVRRGAIVRGQIDPEHDGYAIHLPPKFTGVLLLIADSTVAGTARIDDPAAPPPLPFELSGIVPPAPTATLVVALVDPTTGARVDLRKSEIHVTPAVPRMLDDDVAREVTDPSGARVCEVDVRIGRLLVAFERRGFVAATVDVTLTRQGERHVVEIPLVRASASIRGHVTVEEVQFFGVAQKPAAFVSVYAASQHGFEEVTTAPVAVNEAGRFEITGLAPREYVLVLESHGVAPTIQRVRAAETPPEFELSFAQGDEVQLHFARPRLTFGLTDVMWRIVDAEGLPVANRFHARGQWPVESDRFRETLAPGHYQIVVWSRGCREATREFDVPAEGPVEIELERAR
jgi:RNA polymerase sigma-70 factor (ECF subfamily)